jgi:hypothetical protein
MKLLPNLILISACCWAASAHAVSCQVATKGPVGGVSANVSCGPAHPPTPPPYGSPYPVSAWFQSLNLGTDPASISAAFPGIVLGTFEMYGTQMNTVIQGMEDRELLLLASGYITNGGDQATLSAYAAQDLDKYNLVRWQAAFSQATVSPAVSSYSPAATASAYFAHPALRVAIKSGWNDERWWHASSGASARSGDY